MTRPRPGIGSELLPLVLIMLSVAGTFTLVISVYRRARVKPAKANVAVHAPVPASVPAARPAIAPLPDEPEEPEPVEPPAPAPLPPPALPQEDPTKKAIARLAEAEANERTEARKADARAAALESARRAAVAKSERTRRRVALVRAQVDNLTAKADRLEQETQALAMERDVLARERDLAKAALQKARTTSSYAVLPNKSPNGTWRRPIVIECRNGEVTLQPNGPTFSMLQISELMGFRASPIVKAVARELIRLEGTNTPDGAPSVPYIFFVVRPDGIRPYYEARARLEPLGIAFGYELVDQDWEIDYPEPDDHGEGGSRSVPRNQPGTPVADRGELSWPGDANRNANANDSADSFVWPARPTARADNRGRGGDPTGRGFGSRGEMNDGPGGERIAGGPGEDGPTDSGESAGGLGGWRSRRGTQTDPVGSGGGGFGAERSFASPNGGPRSASAGDAGGFAGGQGGSRSLSPGGARSAPAGGGTQGWPGNSTRSGTGGAESSGTHSIAGRNGGGSEPGSGSDAPRELPVLTAPGETPSAGSGANSRGAGGRPNSAGPQSTAPGGSSHGSGAGADAVDLDALPPPLPGSAGRSNEASPDPASRPFAGRGSLGSPDQSNGTPPQGSTTEAPDASPLAMLGGPESPPSSLTGSPSGSRVQMNIAPDDRSGSDGATGEQGSRNSGSSGTASGTTSGSNRSSTSRSASGSRETTSNSSSPSGASSSASSDGGVPMPFSTSFGAEPPPRKPRQANHDPLRIDARMDIVVACEWNGVVIHPGGYRLTTKAIKSGRDVLVDQLERLVEHRAEKDPLIRLHPHVEFLVEPGGSDTYKLARQQLFSSGLEWPITLQVTETSGTLAKPRGMLR